MRCIVGLALFVAIYFGGCKLLGAVAGAIARANDPRHSQWVAQEAGKNAMAKYHALVAVGAGAVVLLGCSLPTLLSSRMQHDPWRNYDDEIESSYRRR